MFASDCIHKEKWYSNCVVSTIGKSDQMFYLSHNTLLQLKVLYYEFYKKGHVPPAWDPEKFGWKKDYIVEIIKCGCKSANPCKSKKCNCKAHGLPCTMSCQCFGVGKDAQDRPVALFFNVSGIKGYQLIA